MQLRVTDYITNSKRMCVKGMYYIYHVDWYINFILEEFIGITSSR